MKKLVLIVMLCSLFVACKTEEKKPLNGYLITGDAPGVYNGIRVYLQSQDERGRKVNKDTAIVMNEKFTFEGKINFPEMWVLSVNSINGTKPLIVENAYIDIKIDSSDITKSIVTGSESNRALTAFTDELVTIKTKRNTLSTQYRSTIDEDKKKNIADEILMLNNFENNLPFKYIEENKDNTASLIFIDRASSVKEANVEDLINAFSKLDESIQESDYGKKVLKKIDLIKLERTATSATNVGSVAPNFSAPTPNGNQLTLKDALGKVTIVDFWAAWCGPCRRENPNVVNVYNKYHDKGLEIIGVSLDGNSRQKNPKEAWLKAIEQDKLTWKHVSNLNYFNDPVAKAYNIKSIPATFILDEKGKIIAKNLRGAALEAKIAELLN